MKTTVIDKSKPAVVMLPGLSDFYFSQQVRGEVPLRELSSRTQLMRAVSECEGHFDPRCFVDKKGRLETLLASAFMEGDETLVRVPSQQSVTLLTPNLIAHSQQAMGGLSGELPVKSLESNPELLGYKLRGAPIGSSLKAYRLQTQSSATHTVVVSSGASYILEPCPSTKSASWHFMVQAPTQPSRQRVQEQSAASSVTNYFAFMLQPIALAASLIAGRQVDQAMARADRKRDSPLKFISSDVLQVGPPEEKNFIKIGEATPTNPNRSHCTIALVDEGLVVDVDASSKKLTIVESDASAKDSFLPKEHTSLETAMAFLAGEALSKGAELADTVVVKNIKISGIFHPKIWMFTQKDERTQKTQISCMYFNGGALVPPPDDAQLLDMQRGEQADLSDAVSTFWSEKQGKMYRQIGASSVLPADSKPSKTRPQKVALQGAGEVWMTDGVAIAEVPGLKNGVYGAQLSSEFLTMNPGEWPKKLTELSDRIIPGTADVIPVIGFQELKTGTQNPVGSRPIVWDKKQKKLVIAPRSSLDMSPVRCLWDVAQRKFLIVSPYSGLSVLGIPPEQGIAVLAKTIPSAVPGGAERYELFKQTLTPAEQTFPGEVKGHILRKPHHSVNPVRLFEGLDIVKAVMVKGVLGIETADGVRIDCVPDDDANCGISGFSRDWYANNMAGKPEEEQKTTLQVMMAVFGEPLMPFIPMNAGAPANEPPLWLKADTLEIVTGPPHTTDSDITEAAPFLSEAGVTASFNSQQGHIVVTGPDQPTSRLHIAGAPVKDNGALAVTLEQAPDGDENRYSDVPGLNSMYLGGTAQPPSGQPDRSTLHIDLSADNTQQLRHVVIAPPAPDHQPQSIKLETKPGYRVDVAAGSAYRAPGETLRHTPQGFTSHDLLLNVYRSNGVRSKRDEASAVDESLPLNVLIQDALTDEGTLKPEYADVVLIDTDSSLIPPLNLANLLRSKRMVASLEAVLEETDQSEANSASCPASTPVRNQHLEL